MIWAYGIETATALHHDIAERWQADARERRIRRLSWGGDVAERH